MAVLFTSDTHFGHGGARALYRRPFDTVEAMDEAMIGRWNEVVRPEDDVWHLGDFAVRQTPQRMAAILARLAGRKHLIAGNNDPPETLALAGWAEVAAYAELEVGDIRLVLCHYPFRSWNGNGKGSINLHGHSHGRLKPLTRQLDVGVDAWDFRPVTMAQIRAKLIRRKV